MTLTATSIGPIYLVARSALLSELREDYVLMAEAKGLTARQVRRHAQRNALLPVSTIVLIGLGRWPAARSSSRRSSPIPGSDG